jgi:formate hydrogenlyase transcriptional activator
LRRDDIPLLVWHFIEKKQRELGKTISKVSKRVMNALCDNDWPGNVRELENVVERAIILSPGPSLELEGPFARTTHSHRVDSSSANLKDVDRAHIVGVLEECRWQIKGAGATAERLGLKPSTLRYRMKKLGIERPPRRPR